jgi:hypothetical protein
MMQMSDGDCGTKSGYARAATDYRKEHRALRFA